MDPTPRHSLTLHLKARGGCGNFCLVPTEGGVRFSRGVSQPVFPPQPADMKQLRGRLRSFLNKCMTNNLVEIRPATSVRERRRLRTPEESSRIFEERAKTLHLLLPL